MQKIIYKEYIKRLANKIKYINNILLINKNKYLN